VVSLNSIRQELGNCLKVSRYQLLPHLNQFTIPPLSPFNLFNYNALLINPSINSLLWLSHQPLSGFKIIYVSLCENGKSALHGCLPMHVVLSMKRNLSCHLVSFVLTVRSMSQTSQTDFVSYREKSNVFMMKNIVLQEPRCLTSRYNSLSLMVSLLRSSQKVTRYRSVKEVKNLSTNSSRNLSIG
jgi:hypothetical protein